MTNRIGNENANPVLWTDIRRDWKRLARESEPTDEQIRSFVEERGGWVDGDGQTSGWVLVDDGDGSTWCDEVEIGPNELRLVRFATPDSPRCDEDGRVIREVIR